MLTNEYNSRKAEIQKHLKVEERRYQMHPAQRDEARRSIRTLGDELEKLELEYRRTHPQ